MRLAAMAVLLVLAGCGATTRNTPAELFTDMRRQPKYKSQGASAFFSDGRASRPEVPGTVAVGQLREDRNPPPLDAALLARRPW